MCLKTPLSWSFLVIELMWQVWCWTDLTSEVDVLVSAGPSCPRESSVCEYYCVDGGAALPDEPDSRSSPPCDLLCRGFNDSISWRWCVGKEVTFYKALWETEGKQRGRRQGEREATPGVTLGHLLFFNSWTTEMLFSLSLSNKAANFSKANLYH